MNNIYTNNNATDCTYVQSQNPTKTSTAFNKRVDTCNTNELTKIIHCYSATNSTSDIVLNKNIDAAQETTPSLKNITTSNSSEIDKSSSKAEKKHLERIKKLKPVIDEFLQKFEDGNKYDHLMHKFKTDRAQSCFLDAIATTLFGKESKPAASKFTNNLRDHLEDYNIINKNSPIDAGDNRITKAVNKYVMDHYGVNINVVILLDFTNDRFIQDDYPHRTDMYKVPVIFETGDYHQTFYGISLDINSKA
ncbi:MAG: hypothetical protein QS748_08425 [Candidatus Endonucleobacter bathymodioli]|uniref:Uncharacterized protein n=1 Tax=Candidatus Endonucleibacter bathymodioli TaxID=539814 RepID=A0AA90NMC9_9GAMM|nr:hypothetical protein [Candidatus Endonucleobacter bathymodioli]